MILYVNSPGRINLIGEHTDYNGGHVLPCALNLSIQLEFKKTSNKSFIKTDLGYSLEFKIEDNYEKSNIHWENYALGVVNELKKIKKNLYNFNCKIKSNLPSGAGISSSSALVCGLIKGLCELNNINLNNNEIIKISRNVEHNYIGVLGGIMDQYTILNAKKNMAILLDCHNIKAKYINLDLDKYEFLLLDTNVKHNLANTEYNKRVSECKQALFEINKKRSSGYLNLCELNSQEIKEHKNKLKEKIFRRANFVVNENERTLNSANLLIRGKLKEFGKLMYHSHNGLKNEYEVSCKELDFLVEHTKQYDKILGSRMMGGGFGGCTISLIEKNFTKKYIQIVNKYYFSIFKINLRPIIAKPDKGIEIKMIK